MREALPPIRVAIFSAPGLFREGLKRILEDVSTVHVTGFAGSVEEVEAMEGEDKPDFIIVERVEDDPGHNEALTRLLAIPDVQVISLSLDETDIQIYRRKLVGEATAEKLIAALTEEDS